MIRTSKILMLWLGVLFILAACSTAEMEPAVESTNAVEEVMMATSTSSAQDILPTVPPPDSPTAQPTATQLPTPELVRADFPNLGIAPEIANEVWVNADEPVTLASQRGKVVLLEFWTFG